MSQASIDSVHSWLLFELERRGIDAVVYSRHILNLFLNTHFATDLLLAKKEANIFARLPPGPSKIKSKQKCRKRLNSSPFLDEVALKKEMAANCLRSASDETTADSNNDSSVESLIDDLYTKLNNLNLLSDSSSNSNARRVGKPKEKRRESYHDAFPLLMDTPETTPKVNSPNHLDTVWNGQNIFKTQNDFSTESTKTKTQQNEDYSGVNSAHKPYKLSNNNTISQQLKVNGKNKRVRNQRRCNRRRLHPFDSTKKLPSGNRYRQSNYQKHKDDFNKENTNESVPSTSTKKNFQQKPKCFDKKVKRHYNNNATKVETKIRSFFNNAGSLVSTTASSDYNRRFLFTANNSKVNLQPNETKLDSNNEKDLYHLYSMDLPDFYESTRLADDPPPCSKWFRDPQSGCLEFEPAYKSRSNSDTSPSSVESWLWCPSPSLWEEDDDVSPTASQSRFETIYKPPIYSNVSENQACQLWKDYEAIFIDVAQGSAKKSEFSYEKGVDLDDNDCLDLNFLGFGRMSTPTKLKSPQNVQNSIWKDGSYHSFKKDVDKADGDASLFSIAGSSQSRKEIWLKNAEGAENGRKSLIFFQNCFDSVGDTTKKDADRFDGFFEDIFHIWDCCDLRWLFGWDLPEQVSNTSHQFVLPFLPLSTDCSFSHFWSSTCEESLNVGEEDFYKFFDDEDVFSRDFCPGSSLENSIPLAMIVGRNQNSDFPTNSVMSDCNFHSQKHDSTNSSTSLEDCITENQAWKSSLRIGNMWQSISGIRQVNVLYSEKQSDNKGTSMLQPSSYTHFKPIPESELDTTDLSGGSTQDHFTSNSDIMQSAADELVEFLVLSPKKQHTSCDGCSDCDMKIRGLEQDIDNLLCDGLPKNPKPKSLIPHFHKSGEDKSMQTSFEEHIRQIDSNICETFSIRPPKANSR